MCRGWGGGVEGGGIQAKTNSFINRYQKNRKFNLFFLVIIPELSVSRIF